MMPIVDAYVGLSQTAYTLTEYLREPSDFHVLRMVAVEQAASKDAAQNELPLLQKQANTRGFSGFPNAIIASRDIWQTESIAELIASQLVENLRGIHFSLGSDTKICNTDTAICSASLGQLDSVLPLVARSNLVLDITDPTNQWQPIGEIAKNHPELHIVINLFAGEDVYLNNASRSLGELSKLAKYDNVHLKICGARLPDFIAEDVLSQLLVSTIASFGAERIMFASGYTQKHTEPRFDQLWTAYASACAQSSARHRDSLFRSNAIRVYDL